MPSKGSTQKHAKEDDQTESIDTSSNRGQMMNKRKIKGIEKAQK
jgi:hypothetical protein